MTAIANSRPCGFHDPWKSAGKSYPNQRGKVYPKSEADNEIEGN
jgi:hypothetical protein